MTEITSFPLSELTRRIGSGDLSADEVVEAHASRARSINGALDAFTELTGEPVAVAGPLGGIPIGVKDAFVDDGRIPTMGSLVRPTWLSGTAGIVARVRAAGATVLGYTNLHEWAIGTTSTVTATGPIRNPWDLELIAGGSSGGSAAAVAAGCVPVAIGTDAGGSIRVPAACCGVVGFKPSFGVLPLEGEPAASSPLNTVGLIARNVDDIATLFSLLGGRVSFRGSLERVTLGIPHGFFYEEVEERVASVVEEGARLVGRSFGSASAVTMAGVEKAGEVVSRSFLPVVASTIQSHLGSLPEGFEPATAKALRLGLGFGRREAPDTAPVTSAWERAFETCDVVAVPTLPGLPPPIADPKVRLPGGPASADRSQIALNAPMNVAGLPAVSLPCGLCEGLAVGMTLVARRGDDDLVLAAAAELERLTDRAFADRVSEISVGTGD